MVRLLVTSLLVCPGQLETKAIIGMFFQVRIREGLLKLKTESCALRTAFWVRTKDFQQKITKYLPMCPSICEVKTEAAKAIAEFFAWHMLPGRPHWICMGRLGQLHRFATACFRGRIGRLLARYPRHPRGITPWYTSRSYLLLCMSDLSYAMDSLIEDHQCLKTTTQNSRSHDNLKHCGRL